MKINLGSGGKPQDGYVNVDSESRTGVDVVADAGCYLAGLHDSSVEEVLSVHMIEHLTPAQWHDLIRQIERVLVRGGRVIIECPDMKRVCECFASDTLGLRATWWHHCIYGDPANGGAHRQAFWMQRLRDDIEATGLRVVRSVPWGDNQPEGASVPIKYNLRVEAVKP